MHFFFVVLVELMVGICLFNEFSNSSEQASTPLEKSIELFNRFSSSLALLKPFQ